MLAIEPSGHSKGRATRSTKFESGFGTVGCEVTAVNEGSSVVPVVARIEAGWGRQFHRIVGGLLICHRPF